MGVLERPDRGQALPADTSTGRVTQLTDFIGFCEAETGRRFPDGAAFHDYSVAEGRRFWSLFLSWSGLLREGSPEPVLTDERCERARFFPDLRLNYAENLLRIDSPEDAERTAIVARHAGRPPDRLTRLELRDRVLAVAGHLRRMGVAPGDRVVAVAGNNAEAVIGGLAATAVGATFSSAAPDMGAAALISRFEQLAPVVLMTNLVEGGEAAPTALPDRILELAGALPTLRALIALDDGPVPRGLTVPVQPLSELLAGATGQERDAEWIRFPFNHPLFVLFSSGTTGRPKCILHGAGGTLLEHVKEHRLHVDLRPGDRLFFHTSAAWMMWHWQLSALASGSELVLYDGVLTGAETLWRLVSDEEVSVFGTGPPYLQLCEDSGLSPRRELPLPALRAMLSTGSILHDWQYDWVREHVGAVPLQSISGGTDIIGCFVLGNPNLPVRRGRIQCRSLGLDVQALPTTASPPGSPVGELVCRNPFPSRPLGFVGDDGTAFHDAYFSQNDRVWTHGDLIEFDADGQARMHGRSDGVLNVRGMRIGPAEVYRALGDVAEVREAIAVEQDTPDARGRSRMVLLVVLREPASLDGRLAVRIRREIARHASTAHVPDLVVQVDELPTTHSGKRSERAARDAVNGSRAANAEALGNPSSLDAIRRAVALASKRRRELAVAAGDSDHASTEARLRAIWEGVLGVSPLQPHDNFFDVGGTSLLAAEVFQLIHDRIGVDLPLSTLIRAPTTAALAAVIDSPPEEGVPLLVLLRPGATGPPLFLVHAVTGDALPLRSLAMRLETERPVYGIQARGLDPREQPQTRVEDMAQTYVAAIRSVQPSGPYAIAGYSFGGLVAFEMARRLTEQGADVGWLGLVDAELHHRCLPLRDRLRFRVVEPFRVLRWALAAPRTRLPRFVRTAVLRIAPWAPVAPPPPEWPLPPLLVKLMGIGLQASHAYRPRPYAGTATLLAAHVRRRGYCDPIPAWKRVARGGVIVERIPGEHIDALHEANVDVLADRISAHLARLRGPDPTAPGGGADRGFDGRAPREVGARPTPASVE